MRVAAALVVSLAVSVASAAGEDLVKRGEYLARAGDCIACHTAPGGKPMAGGLEIPTPLGSIISTNITPSKTAGIGNYTYAQFARALRSGIRGDGERLYPAMPYTSYAIVGDDDTRALYAYFMQGVAPVDTKPTPTELPFPFDVRISMAAWNLLFLDKGTFEPDPARGAEWNRGAYLVRGLGHCGTCHSPRNFLMAEENRHELGGGKVGWWDAPNITSAIRSGIGGWSAEELVEYLRTGHAKGKSQAAGPMAEAVDNSLRFLSTEDLHAMAAYLKTTTLVHDVEVTKPAYEWGAPADELRTIRGVEWPSDPDQASGAQLYDAHCASCHHARGEGSFEGGLPPLFHNAALGRLQSANLVLVILEGVRRALDPPELRMPGFADALSDRQVVTLVSYLLKLYGNPAASVTVEEVHALRSPPGESHLVALARAALVVAALLVLALMALLLRRAGRPR